jgi:lysozyme family protein
MLPFVALATAIIPELVKVIVGDKAGRVADSVAEAVTEVTGASTAEEAQRRLEADPKVAANLRIRLAEIALEQSQAQYKREADALDARRQAEAAQRRDELEKLRTQYENDQKMRDRQFQEQQAQIKAAIEQTAGARTLQLDLVRTGSHLQWAPVVVSAVVTLLFATTVILLLVLNPPSEGYRELVNICVGALVAGFSTVISFWLGSSQGSRDKDSTVQKMQAAQATQASQQIEIVAKQATDLIRVSEEVRQRPVEVPVPVAVAVAPPTAKGSTFEDCLTLVLGAEGGFANDPRDRGGATKYGITIHTLGDWRRSKTPDAQVTVEDVRALEVDEAKEIYRSRYWNVMRCDDLPKGVDLLVFDFGVNAGPGRSARILQDVLGVHQDGSIGPVTINGFNTCPVDKVIREFSAKRLEYYRSLPDFATFGAGWTNRTNSMLEAALRMSSSSRPQ